MANRPGIVRKTIRVPYPARDMVRGLSKAMRLKAEGAPINIDLAPLYQLVERLAKSSSDRHPLVDIPVSIPVRSIHHMVVLARILRTLSRNSVYQCDEDVLKETLNNLKNFMG